MIDSPVALTPATLAPPWSAKERALSARRARLAQQIRSVEKRHAELVDRAAQLGKRHAELIADREDVEAQWQAMRENRQRSA